MPHDRKGQVLQAGDRVMIPAVVKEVYAGETACNAQFEVEANPDVPEEYRPTITFNTRLVEKVPDTDADRAIRVATAAGGAAAPRHG